MKADESREGDTKEWPVTGVWGERGKKNIPTECPCRKKKKVYTKKKGKKERGKEHQGGGREEGRSCSGWDPHGPETKRWGTFHPWVRKKK